jgi:pimeloyl-ACP methyl ester carboxylesterase
MWRMPFISALLRTYRQKDWTYLEAHALESALELAKGSAPGLEGEQQELTMAILCRENTVPWKRTSSIDQRRVEYRAAAAAYDQSNPNKFAPFTAEEWGMAAFLLQYDRLIACPVQKTALPSMSDLKFGWPASLPVLVVNGDYDIQTPNEDAQLAAAQFQKAQFARLKHHGHSILPESFCAVGLLREFLNNKRVADPMKCYDADATGASLEKGKPQG